MGTSMTIWSSGVCTLPCQPHFWLNTGKLPTIKGSSLLGRTKSNRMLRSPKTVAALTSEK